MAEYGEVIRQMARVERGPTPGTVCAALGGTLEPSGTCHMTSRSPMEPPCLAACASCDASDAYGACYAFQRLPDGTSRARYRGSDACVQAFEAFERCTRTCRGADGWGHGHGEYVAPLEPTARCAGNVTRQQCKSGGWEWHDAARSVPCAAWPSSGATLSLDAPSCAAACLATGGALRDGACDVPRCAPTL